MPIGVERHHVLVTGGDGGDRYAFEAIGVYRRAHRGRERRPEHQTVRVAPDRHSTIRPKGRAELVACSDADNVGQSLSHDGSN